LFYNLIVRSINRQLEPGGTVMNLTATRTNLRNPLTALSKTRVRPTAVYSGIIILALIAFEAFNYSTTAYALRDLLGNMRFGAVRWATLMALAFCALDFAGIARLVTQRGRQESQKEAWYLFTAWLLAAAFNAALTWWGVSLALTNHSARSASIDQVSNLVTIIPVIVAIMVWVIRILIIGMLTSALERGKENRTPGKSVTTTSAGFPVSSKPVPHYAAARNMTNPRVVSARQSSTRSNDFISAEQNSRRF
jgi:hypothetical protein